MDEPTRGPADRARRLLDRPVLLTALLGVAFIVYQGLWLHRSGFIGAMDVDQAGGVSTSFRLHRAFHDGPTAFRKTFFGTGNAPLLPALSTPFLIVGTRSLTFAMLVQPLMVALAAVGAAGATRATVGNRAALVAGIGVIGMPVLIVSSRSFQYSTGVGAFLSLALWGLLASDHGRRRLPMIGFGAAVGAMLISRTMSIGFVPAVAIAALLVTAWRERRVLANGALAVVAAVAVAGPWWWSQWDYIRSYLGENAYGGRAQYFGSTALTDRARDNVEYLDRDYMLAFPALPAIVIALSVASLVAWLRSDAGWRTWPGFRREVLALWAVVVAGYAALLSTSNLGYWFASPLEVVLVVALVVTACSLPAFAGRVTPRIALGIGAVVGCFVALRLADSTGDVDRPDIVGVWVTLAITAVVALRPQRWPATTGVFTVALAVVTLVASTSPVGGGGGFGPRPWSAAVISDLDDVQYGNLWADGRLASTDLDDRRRAAAEWWAAHEQVIALLVELEERSPTLETVSGSSHLFGFNTLQVAEELSPVLGVRAMETLNTLEAPDSDIVTHLTPEAGGRTRVLVVIESRSLPFPDDRGVPRLLRLAAERGWEPYGEVPLPDGGRVVVYDHEDAGEGGR